MEHQVNLLKSIDFDLKTGGSQFNFNFTPVKICSVFHHHFLRLSRQVMSCKISVLNKILERVFLFKCTKFRITEILIEQRYFWYKNMHGTSSKKHAYNSLQDD